MPSARVRATKSSKKSPLLVYPDGTEPRISDECERLRTTNNTYQFWVDRANAFHKEKEFPHALAAEALAYTRHDNNAFLAFSKDILGFKDIYPPFHGEMLPYITGLLPTTGRGRTVTPYRMLLAFRGSLKSTLMNGLASWRIAQSTVNHDWEECSTRIAMASEKIALAKQNVGAVRNMVDSELFRTRFGRHKPVKRDEGSWGNEMFTSRLQKSLYTRDPTVFTMSLSVDRTGFHCTTILADDLQARSSTFNLEQIEKAYELYRLLHSILDPSTSDEFTEMMLGGTVWHYDDVYARIEAESKKEEEKKRSSATYLPFFHVKKIPAESEVERAQMPGDLNKWVTYKPVFEGSVHKETYVRTAAWKDRFPLETLDQIKSHQGGEIYASQYLLDPIPTADRVFNRSDVRYRDALSDEKLFANNYFTLIGGDPAWISQESVRAREGSSTANSVLITAAIDPAYNIHILSVYRKKSAIPEFTEELWRLYFDSKYRNVLSCALQQFDYKYLIPEFKRKFMETKKQPNVKWVSSGGGKEDHPSKDDRIRARLSGLWSAHKILLPRGLTDVENEFFDFPKGRRKDVLDALSNIVEIMSAPQADAATEARRNESTSIIDGVESGTWGQKEIGWKDAY